MKYHLYKWSIVDGNDPYVAPEWRKLRLHGFRDQEAQPVNTSHIVSVNGKEITTYSGSVYILEDIDPQYLSWLETQGIPIDLDNPIIIKGK